MIQTNTPKGRLESLMDDFTDVHGTVLLGMHKEIQTLKSDVERCVGERIESVLHEINEAGTELKQHLEHSNAVLDKAIAQSKSNLTSIKALGNKALEDIASEKRSGLAEFNALRSELEQSRAEFQSEASIAEERVTRITSELQTKLTAALSYSSKMNSESQKILKKIRERQELLYKREIELQKRTRQFTISAVLVVLATVTAWIWLTLNH